jgi:hypothetical protein
MVSAYSSNPTDSTVGEAVELSVSLALRSRPSLGRLVTGADRLSAPGNTAPAMDLPSCIRSPVMLNYRLDG